MVPDADFGLQDHRVVIVAGETAFALQARGRPHPRGFFHGDDVEPSVAGEMGVLGRGRVLLDLVVEVCARLGQPVVAVDGGATRAIEFFEPDDRVSGLLRGWHDELIVESGGWPLVGL